MIGPDAPLVAFLTITGGVDVVLAGNHARSEIRLRVDRVSEGLYGGVEARLGNSIVRERLPRERVVWSGCCRERVVDGRGPGEVACQVGGSGNVACVVRCLTNPDAFVVTEHVPMFVLFENSRNEPRTACRGAELIPPICADRRYEETARVKNVVAEVFPSVCVPCIRAGLGHNVDGGARSMPVGG